MRRFLREEGAWEYHLERTRQCILNEYKKRKPQSVSILGSGWLLDVPLKELLDGGAKVSLIDIAHPPRILHKYRNTKNVRFVTCDLTGSIDAILRFIKKSHSHQDSIKSILRNPSHEIDLNDDLCISVNTLSQLHVQLIEILERRKRIDKKLVNDLIGEIQLSHIDFLPKGKSLLITDFEEELYDDNDKLFGVNPRVFVNFGDYQKIENWSWDFDSSKTFDQNYRVKLNVTAFRV